MTDLYLTVPEAGALAFALIYLIVGLVLRRWRWLLGILTLLGFGYLFYLSLANLTVSGTAFGVLAVSPFSRMLDTVFIAGAVLTLLVFMDIKRLPYEAGFFLITGTLGAMLLAKAVNLIMLVLALETLSFSLYALVALSKRKRDAEASVKYFVLGAFSSGFLLMGTALLYALAGGFGFSDVRAAAAGPGQNLGLLVAGLALLSVGLLFKVSAVPFHFWTPDVFEGARAPVAGFIATASKAAAFGLLITVMNTAFGSAPELWATLVWWVAVLTMFAGNTAALLEKSVKRMLAYSTIAHAGYLLTAVLVGGSAGLSSMVFYMLVYTLMTCGAFAVVSVVGDEATGLSFYKGLAKRRPLLAFLMTLFMLSLAGVPPLAGFVAKFYIFTGAMSAGFTSLAIIGFINGVISAFYYLRVVVYMYASEPETPEALPPLRRRAWTALGLALASLAVVLLGVLPGPLLAFIRAFI